MRRYLKPFGSQTPGEKLGMIDGTNLFFGALLGANLGTIEDLPLSDYAVLIIFLAGTVVTLRQFSTSERRPYAYGLLAFYALAIVFVFYGSDDMLESLSPTVRDRLAITLAIWTGSVVMAELYPTREPAGAAPRSTTGGSDPVETDETPQRVTSAP